MDGSQFSDFSFFFTENECSEVSYIFVFKKHITTLRKEKNEVNSMNLKWTHMS